MKIGNFEFYTHTRTNGKGKERKRIGVCFEPCESCPMFDCYQEWCGEYYETCEYNGKEPFYDITFVCYLPNFIKKIIRKSLIKKQNKWAEEYCKAMERMMDEEH